MPRSAPGHDDGVGLLPPGELVEPLLHGGKFSLQIGDLVIAARGLCAGLLGSRRRSVVILALARPGAGERAEQAKRALEGCKVLAHLLLHGLEGRRPEGMGETAPILLLLAGERIEAEFKIARHQPLHAVAIEADQLSDRKSVV